MQYSYYPVSSGQKAVIARIACCFALLYREQRRACAIMFSFASSWLKMPTLLIWKIDLWGRRSALGFVNFATIYGGSRAQKSE